MEVREAWRARRKQAGLFPPNDTDFNTFNADRKLLALQSLMQALGKLPQKKSLIYFSNGITQSGADNQSGAPRHHRGKR